MVRIESSKAKQLARQGLTMAEWQLLLATTRGELGDCNLVKNSAMVCQLISESGLSDKAGMVALRSLVEKGLINVFAPSRGNEDTFKLTVLGFGVLKHRSVD